MSAKNPCACHRLYRDPDFATAKHFQDLWANIQGCGLKRVPVAKPINQVGFKEHWFVCPQTGRVWRLVEPDFPYRGMWEEVEEAYQPKGAMSLDEVSQIPDYYLDEEEIRELADGDEELVDIVMNRDRDDDDH